MKLEKSRVFGILTGIMFLFMINFISAASRWSFQGVLNTWAAYGVFKYALPFLLVFALLFGILTKITLLGDNRAVHAIIAAALGLLSLVGDYFPNFLEKFAPNLAVGISVLLAAIILLGLFYDPNGKSGITWVIYVLFGIGVIAFILIVSDTFSGYSGLGYNIWEDYGPALVTLLILAGIIAAIVVKPKSGP
jgi:hypothetical protein